VYLFEKKCFAVTDYGAYKFLKPKKIIRLSYFWKKDLIWKASI